MTADLWVVVETSDHGEPICAICATRADAEHWMAGYLARWPFADPEVRPYTLDREYHPRP